MAAVAVGEEKEAACYYHLRQQQLPQKKVRVWPRIDARVSVQSHAYPDYDEAVAVPS